MKLPTSVFQSREPARSSKASLKWLKRCSASPTEVVWHGKWLVVTTALETQPVRVELAEIKACSNSCIVDAGATGLMTHGRASQALHL